MGLASAVALALLSSGEVQPSMLRVVVRNVSSNLPPDAFARKPKTTFRMGSCCLRVEEALDPARKIQLLVIVKEPDLWLVNRIEGTADHLVDPGPTFVARSPLVDDPGLQGLEIGHELSYMKAHNAAREVSVPCAGGRCHRYVAESGGYRVTLLTTLAGDRPTEVHVKPPAGPDVVIAYDAYEADLPADPGLFRPPAGLTIRERSVTQGERK